jgi:hypothetical protein
MWENLRDSHVLVFVVTQGSVRGDDSRFHHGLSETPPGSLSGIARVGKEEIARKLEMLAIHANRPADDSGVPLLRVLRIRTDVTRSTMPTAQSRSPLPIAAIRRGFISCLVVAGLLGAAAGARAEGPPAAPAATPLLDEAYQRRAAGDVAGAVAAFEAAAAAGGDRQRISMELGYLAVASGDEARARRCFEEAGRGPDAELRRRARDELRFLPNHFGGDAYAEIYGWGRFAGAARGGDVVPTLRLRALYRPTFALDLSLYAVAQATRDLASTGGGGGALPVIYADNYAVLGAGLLARVWRRQIGIFAQAGPAFDLLDDGQRRVAFDARVGAYLGWETAGCAPPAATGVTTTLWPCAEVYAEAVYVSRFSNDVIAFARPRFALTYLLVGPLAWQLVVEGRVAKDRNDDYYNNFADAGVGQRFRLVKPLRIDLMLGIHGGAFFGLASRDPAPRPLTYADVRLQAATYLEF